LGNVEGVTVTPGDKQPKADDPTPADRAADRLDEQEEESFPASDPHADWAGPAN
jgi:hypothetical protein